MSESIVERVARAIYAEWASLRTTSAAWEEHSEKHRDAWRKEARAAIAAMREPTLEMVEAYKQGLRILIRSVPENERIERWKAPRKGLGYLIPDDEKCCARWQAMIDAALAGKEPRHG
jgi:hypothetical protein